MLDLLDERVDVTALAAAEAVEVPVVGPHVEGRRLLVVEGTQALHRATTGVLQGDVGGDDVVDASLLAHLGDVLIANPSRHAWSLSSARAPGNAWAAACDSDQRVPIRPDHTTHREDP